MLRCRRRAIFGGHRRPTPVSVTGTNTNTIAIAIGFLSKGKMYQWIFLYDLKNYTMKGRPRSPYCCRRIYMDVIFLCLLQEFATNCRSMQAEDQIDRIREANYQQSRDSEPVSGNRSKLSGPNLNVRAPIIWARLGLYPRNTTRALILASSIGSPTSIARFLERGADIEARGRDGDTPLIAAAGGGHVAATALLLASGADPRAVNRRGQSALDKAASRHDAAGRATCALLRRRLTELEPPLPPPSLPVASARRTTEPTIAHRALRSAAVAASSLLFGWTLAAAGLFATGHFDPWLIEH